MSLLPLRLFKFSQLKISFCIVKLVGVLLLCMLASVVVADEKKILVVGDSLSSAYQIDKNAGWVNLLTARLQQHNYQYKVINASTSGYTTANALVNIQSHLNKHRPDVVVIWLGGNDGLRGFAPKTIEQNLNSLVALAQDEKAQVLLLGVTLPLNYGKRYLSQVAAVFERVADKYQIGLVKNALQKVPKNWDYFQDDGVHPRATAQPLILDEIWPQLQKIL